MPTLQELQSSYNSATSVAQAAYAAMQKCVGGHGAPKNAEKGACKNGQPLSSDHLPVFGSPADSSKCHNCDTLTTSTKSDCAKVDTCVSRVNDYNAKLAAMNAAKAALDSYKPTPKEQQDIKDQDKNRQLRNNIIIIIVLVLLIILGIWIYRKFKKQ